MTDAKAGKQGVLLASLGTIAELGELCRICEKHPALAALRQVLADQLLPSPTVTSA